jgi:hypothetical protein
VSPVVDDPLRIGSYTLVRPLGTGASGAVHQAKDERDGRPALRACREGQIAERCVRVDGRLLTDPTAQLRINADQRSTRVIAKGIELEELALWAAP